MYDEHCNSIMEIMQIELSEEFQKATLMSRSLLGCLINWNYGTLWLT